MYCFFFLYLCEFICLKPKINSMWLKTLKSCDIWQLWARLSLAKFNIWWCTWSYAPGTSLDWLHLCDRTCERLKNNTFSDIKFWNVGLNQTHFNLESVYIYGVGKRGGGRPPPQPALFQRLCWLPELSSSLTEADLTDLSATLTGVKKLPILGIYFKFSMFLMSFPFLISASRSHLASPCQIFFCCSNAWRNPLRRNIWPASCGLTNEERALTWGPLFIGQSAWDWLSTALNSRSKHRQ